MGTPKNQAELLMLIRERLAKLEKDENMQLSDDFRYGFTLGYMDMIEYAHEQMEREGK